MGPLIVLLKKVGINLTFVFISCFVIALLTKCQYFWFIMCPIQNFDKWIFVILRIPPYFYSKFGYMNPGSTSHTWVACSRSADGFLWLLELKESNLVTVVYKLFVIMYCCLNPSVYLFCRSVCVTDCL